MPITAVVEYHPSAGKNEEVEAILRGMIGPVRGEPGCLRYELLSRRDAFMFLLVETYADPAAIEVHRATDHYMDYRARIEPLLASPIKPAIFDPVEP